MHFREVLGRGGFGAVYLADVHGRDGFVQRVAIKILSAEMTEIADIAARQRDEARLLARLSHDSIVRVYDLVEIFERPAVLMEYVEGVDANVLRKRAPIPARAALQIAAATASALDAASTSPGPDSGLPLRVVHRDIKPANLLVSRHGGIKVLDFGVARANFEREGQTASMQFGTARFMAPEQWLSGEATEAVDIYALGVSLVELLVGQALQRAPLLEARFAEHTEAAIAALGAPDWPPGVQAKLQQLVREMLAYHPEDRPTAAVLHDQLLTLIDQVPGESIERLARREIPPLIEARRAQLADGPLPEDSWLGSPPAKMIPVDTSKTEVPHKPPPPPSAHTGVSTLRLPTPRLHRRWWWLSVLLAMGTVLGLAWGIGMYLWPGWARPAPTSPTPTLSSVAPAAARPEPTPPREQHASTQTEPTAKPTAEPTAEPAAKPTAEPAPIATPQASVRHTGPAATPPTPEPAPVTTEEPPTPTATTVEVTFTSRPMGAGVLVDGHRLGLTPLFQTPLTTGEHTVEMHFGTTRISHDIHIIDGHPTKFIWDSTTGTWGEAAQH